LEKANLYELEQKIARSLSSQSAKSSSKPSFFISMPALFSIEINAHSLTYLLLLALEKKITDEALQLTLFNSQICEGYFRTARSMSGSFFNGG
jgi:hypothetical protein